MSKARKISKRIDLNEYEADLLRIKASQCGMKEGPYLRELITGYGPKTAPPAEFYEAMNRINRIGININQLAKVANETGVIDEKMFKNAYKELIKLMNEVKEIVQKPEPYQASYYERLIYLQRKARQEGKPEPKFGDDLFAPPEE